MDAAVVEAAREANVRLILLAACYERGGFDGSPLGPGQSRFRTADLDQYWKQVNTFPICWNLQRAESNVIPTPDV